MDQEGENKAGEPFEKGKLFLFQFFFCSKARSYVHDCYLHFLHFRQTEDPIVGSGGVVESSPCYSLDRSIVRSFNRSSIVIIFFFYFDQTNAWVAFSFSDASGHNRSSQGY
jgi:hypothetical protein